MCSKKQIISLTIHVMFSLIKKLTFENLAKLNHYKN